LCCYNDRGFNENSKSKRGIFPLANKHGDYMYNNPRTTNVRDYEVEMRRNKGYTINKHIFVFH